MLVTTYGYGHAVPGGRAAIVQLHRTRGARFHVSGIPWKAGRAALSRIYAAFETCDLPRISGAFTLHIRPLDGVQDFALFDLPIALAMLAQSGVVPGKSLERTLSLGELALDGQIQVLRQMAQTCTHPTRLEETAIDTLLLPQGVGRNILAFAPEGRGFRAEHLNHAVGFLQGEHLLPAITVAAPWKQREAWDPEADSIWNKLRWAAHHQRALIAAAAGQLPLLIIGSSGTGKSQMARALHELLPKLSQKEHAEIEAIHRQRELAYPPSERPPFQSPHHRCSTSGLIGTVNAKGQWSPGAWSLAHRGVLCFDELAEFSRDCIESFRGPLETGEWHLARAQHSRTLQSASWVVATSNPCPCGQFHEGPGACGCSPGQVRHYQSRISGPIADRFSLHLETSNHALPEPTPMDLRTARQWVGRCITYLKGANRERWSAAAVEAVNAHVTHFNASARGYAQLKRIARTHAALRHTQSPESPSDQQATTSSLAIEATDVAFATQMRIFDRPHWWQKPELT